MAVHYIKFLKSDTYIVLNFSRLPDIVQNCFCTPDEFTFQIKYVPMNHPSSMYLAAEIKQIPSVKFFLNTL